MGSDATCSIEDILYGAIDGQQSQSADKDVEEGSGGMGKKGISGSPSMAPTLRSASTIHASLRWMG